MGNQASRRRRLAPELVGAAVVASLVLCARASLADHYTVPSGSMRPTVHIGDRIAVDKTAYGLRVPALGWVLSSPAYPERGDVVVLRSPEDGRVLLKRVVAVAGDRVEVREGDVLLDGLSTRVTGGGGAPQERFGERTHDLSLVHGGGVDLGPTRVPDGMLLVMGDDRGGSHDGRRFGFVSRQALLGRAVAVFERHGSWRWLVL
jgi:signal peptidase I